MNVKSIDVTGFALPDNFNSYEEFFDWRFDYSIKNKIRKILDGGNGVGKVLKKIGLRVLNSIKLGTISRILFIRIDKSLKEKKLIEGKGSNLSISL